mmetsp:Transcript_3113/g.6590  ORF Transcript_3113/g.6590 Transcript_3113/m.6590 type:complete len:162 (-) Transcript_3113:10856-11341(-)
MGVVKWIFQSIARDPSPLVQWNVVKHILKLHADTIDDKHPELENHESPSGVFWPLSNTPDDLCPQERTPANEVASILWSLFNDSNDCTGRFRIGLSQIYRAIWRLDAPPVLKDTHSGVVDLGPFQGWADSGMDSHIHHNPMVTLKRKGGPTNKPFKLKFRR